MTPLRNYARRSLEAVDWQNVEVFVAFSKTWDPPVSLIHFGIVRTLLKSRLSRCRAAGDCPTESRREL